MGNQSRRRATVMSEVKLHISVTMLLWHACTIFGIAFKVSQVDGELLA